MTFHRRRRWAAGLLVAALAMGVTSAGASGHPGILPPHNPARNWNPGRVETNSILHLVNRARASVERLGPLRLNIARYNRLTIPEQLFVIANLERVSRGEVPIYGLTASLNAAAAVGARRGTDPTPGRGWSYVSFASIWAEAPNSRTQVVFYADFAWMYEDGPPPFYGIVNQDCYVRGERGCWVHRNNILEAAPDFTFGNGSLVLLAGAAGGVGNYQGSSSLAMAFIWTIGVPTTGITYTWARAVKFLSMPASETGTTTTTVPTTTTTTTVPTTTTTTLPTTTTTLPVTTTTS